MGFGIRDVLLWGELNEGRVVMFAMGGTRVGGESRIFESDAAMH